LTIIVPEKLVRGQSIWLFQPKKKPKQKQNIMCVRITVRIRNSNFVQLMRQQVLKTPNSWLKSLLQFAYVFTYKRHATFSKFTKATPKNNSRRHQFKQSH
jgi:hypothetical protein